MMDNAATYKLSSKIIDLAQLAKIVEDLKGSSKKVVHCHGVFDILHLGHIKHLSSAKKQGDCLIVTLTPDEFVNKGPGRPVFDQISRAETLAALEQVDFVAINKWATATETIKMVKPDIYAKGIEYANSEDDETGNIDTEIAAIKSINGVVHYTDEQVYSSSDIINRHISLFPNSTESWLNRFRSKYSAADVLGYLDQVSDLAPLIVGEAIIDEYVSCVGMGKSAKDPILSFHQKSTQTFIGGSLAVANHLAGLCDNVSLLTVLGKTNSRQSLIEDSLKPNVTPTFIEQENAPTIHKRRFVDEHTQAKVMELYLMDDAPMTEATHSELSEQLKKMIANHKTTFVTDYGHGMISRSMVDILVERSPYLVVNTQANSGNRGFHTISKYPSADYVSLNGIEVELETRHRELPLHQQLEIITKNIDCPRITITLGRQGSLHYWRDNGIIEAPALALRVVDRVGAGDAVLAVTGLLSAIDTPSDIIGLITNIVGAKMVDSIGNKTVVERSWLDRHIKSILK
jgi:rfaE bifunctional protein nucleotidyltransferase chain/domain